MPPGQVQEAVRIVARSCHWQGRRCSKRRLQSPIFPAPAFTHSVRHCPSSYHHRMISKTLAVVSLTATVSQTANQLIKVISFWDTQPVKADKRWGNVF